MKQVTKAARANLQLINRFRSRAFRSGFLDGLGAVTLYLKPQSYTRYRAIDSSIEHAWKVMGSGLRTSIAKVKELDTTTGKAACSKR